MECATEVNAKNLEMEESLKRPGVVGSIGNNSIVQINGNGKESRTEQNKHWLEEKRNALMVVASLIATMAFQVGVNPPGGVWQETKTGNSVDEPHVAGESVYAKNHHTQYGLFLISNTTGLIASLSIILLLVSGFPMSKIFVWILMVITWIAITAVALTYLISTIVVTPGHVFHDRSYSFALYLATFIWVGLMLLLLIGHTIKMIGKLTKCLSQEKTTGSSGTPIKMIGKLMKCLSQEKTAGSSGTPSHHTV